MDGGGPLLLDRNCKHLDIDPFAYLRDVLRRPPAHPADQLD
jgi:IS66 C-terminal element